MMDFPSAPSVGQKYPAGPTPGLPVYEWDGVKWGPSRNLIGALPSNIAPLMDGIAAPGSADRWSRGDHVHPTDTRYAPLANPTFTGTLGAQTLNVGGNITIGGKISSQADGHHIGNTVTALGAATNWNDVTPNDANVIFYDFTNNNWCGIGVDQNGWFWIRTGIGGSNNQSAFVSTSDNCTFNGAPYAPSPANGDNSNKLATTAYVVANQPMGGPYLPATGGTVYGTMTVSYGHIMSYRAGGTTGVVYLSSGDRYFYYDGSNYVFGTDALNTAAGRVWGSNDWSRPVTSARIGGHAGDPGNDGNSGLSEPYGGAVITGVSSVGWLAFGGYITRYRYNQIYVEGTWYTAGYA
jgi:hypothetical protein